MNEYLVPLLSFLSLLLSLLVVWRMNRKLAVFEDLAYSVSDLLRYEEDEEGNPLIDARLEKMLASLSSSLATSLKMSVLGSLSGQSRLEKGLKGAMAQDFMEKKAPLLNLIGDVLGYNTTEYVTEHPDAIMQLLPLAQQFLSVKQGVNSPNRPTEGGVFTIG